MEYFYRTDFHLTNPVRDWQDASDYLTELDMAEYLKKDIRYDVSYESSAPGRYSAFRDFPVEDIILLEWVLDDNDWGHIELRTAQRLNDEQLAAISEFVKGQNSDGLGEGFEQQDFANYIDMFEYQIAKEQYEEDYASIEEEIRYEHGDDESMSEDDINDLIEEQAESLQEPCEDDFEICASFDWRTNSYQFKDITALEYEKIDSMRKTVLDNFQKISSRCKDYIKPDNLCMVYFQNGLQENELRDKKEVAESIDEIFDVERKGLYVFVVGSEGIICEGTVRDILKTDIVEKLKTSEISKKHYSKDER